MYGLKKWEIALLLAVVLTLLLGAAPGCAWWGAVYPELTPDAGVQSAFSAPAAACGVELRFRTLEWLCSALRALGAA